MYTVRDRGRQLDFEGALLGAGTSYSDAKPRWFEVSIYKTAGGKYVVAGIGRSRVVHSTSCSKVGNAKLQQNEAGNTRTSEGFTLVPCEVCRPDARYDSTVQELDREWAQVSDEPEAVLERLRLRDSDGVWYVPSTSTRALEQAGQNDDGIQRALFAPQHID